MNRGQSNRIRNMPLPERKRITPPLADHLASRNAPDQMQQQVDDSLFRRTLCQHRQGFGGFARVLRDRSFDLRLSLDVIKTSSTNLGACEGADLYAGQRGNRDVRGVFKDRSGREEVSGLQEFQDMPAAVRKLNVAESPSRTQNEDIAGSLRERQSASQPWQPRNSERRRRTAEWTQAARKSSRKRRPRDRCTSRKVTSGCFQRELSPSPCDRISLSMSCPNSAGSKYCVSLATTEIIRRDQSGYKRSLPKIGIQFRKPDESCRPRVQGRFRAARRSCARADPLSSQPESILFPTRQASSVPGIEPSHS